VDPKRSGAGGCVGDIGTHAENLAEYITGLKIRNWPPTPPVLSQAERWMTTLSAAPF